MAAKKKRRNPFYFLLVLVGMTFTLTACAYGVMTVRGIHPELVDPASESGEGLMHLLDKHGFSLLMWQIGILGFLTVAAMISDSYWCADAYNSSESTDNQMESDKKTTDPHP